MRDRIVIIGAGGHGKVCADVAKACGYSEIAVLDDSPSKKGLVNGTTADLPDFINDYDVFIGIGDNTLRKTFFEKAEALGASFATLIHPATVISASVMIGCGSVVMPGVVINAGARIGRGVIVNTSASVDHDCRLSDFSHVGVGAHLAGSVKIGTCTFLGAGVIIINNISVCENAIIGAGAVVIRQITVPGTYVGVPTRKIK